MIKVTCMVYEQNFKKVLRTINTEICRKLNAVHYSITLKILMRKRQKIVQFVIKITPIIAAYLCNEYAVL